MEEIRVINETVDALDNGGKKIYRELSNGIEQWIEFDSNGNEIHFRNSVDYEYKREYDINGNEIRFTDSDGEDTMYEYDSEKRMTLRQHADGHTTEFEYYENGVLFSVRDIYPDGTEEYYEYDEDGNPVSW